ncbi:MULTISPECIES: MauE/DoxX family redox-associated membrane protein [unclassified Nonomuraea]|uniref:MauE/DoxX family redox-associated membrane protein n=1 Tax=Nonomuraea sp. NPDC003804 TaxID=3154547 RepID=UPI0033A96524
MTLLVLRYGLAAILAVAVLGKARHFAAFRGSLGGYGLYGPLAWAGAFTVLAVEALAAALAVSTVDAALVGVVGTVLGTIFTGLQVHLLATGNRAPCLCFGTAAPVSATSLAHAAVVLLAGLVLLLAG